MKTKQIVMTSAHAIFKMQNVTFSEALTLAWKKTKQGVKAIVMKCNRLVKSVGIGYETVYFNELVFTNIVVSRESVNNSGARHDYGIGAYNGD
jgi:hypothetical protein